MMSCDGANSEEEVKVDELISCCDDDLFEAGLLIIAARAALLNRNFDAVRQFADQIEPYIEDASWKIAMIRPAEDTPPTWV